MPTADAYIEALQRRMRLHAYRTRGSNGVPPGWDGWFVSTRPPPGAQEHADAIVAELAARPPRAPEPAGPDPGPWRAFLATWRQGWEPLDPEDRPLRIFAGGFSVLWHVALFVAMMWLLLTGFDRSAATPLGEEDVVQVEFIGDGAPDEPGGGPGGALEAAPTPVASLDAPDVATPAPPPDASALRVAGAASTEPSAAPVSEAEAPLPTPSFEVARPVPPTELAAATPSPPVEREIPMPEPREQPLQVSEPVPDTTADFLLPPPAPVVEPVLTTPELQAAERQPVQREIPAPPRRLEPAPVAAPAIAGAELELPPGAVAEREIPMPAPVTPLPPAPQLRVRSTPTPEARLEPGQRVVRERGIPMPVRSAPTDTAGSEGAGDASPAEAVASTPGADQAPSDAEQGASEAAGQASPGTGAAASLGPRPTPAPGGWTDPVRGDDWGAAERNRDGARAGDLSGLYDSAGRVRLAETPGSSASGDPPGTITEEIANLDRAGTWLRRPPIGYEPTTFDRFWQPNETLLEEWVRRSVTTVRIPIPGTSKTLVCQTVMLALGGGCGIEDPNMVEQPASARPPPDIPFKPELQEGGGAAPAAG